jgi:hypothetical protein
MIFSVGLVKHRNLTNKSYVIYGIVSLLHTLREMSTFLLADPDNMANPSPATSSFQKFQSIVAP